eukprot:TRINITY_DN3436_c0_g1_i1.p1 TRINITY_DN3436_c0_g1~~TRINITY_DN3436_c0_g1_i1.p1  ORF type:complete len:1170 (-),score=291.47 TRINITY_DN3436_c0_g1_i1:132-3641(-)
MEAMSDTNTPSVPVAAEEENIELSIQLSETYWEPQIMSLPKKATARQTVLAIGRSGRIPIEHPEAYGLCFPLTKEMVRVRKQQAKKGMKVGLFRDDTQWLDENHSLEYYGLKDGDSLLFKVKNIHLSRAQKVRVLIPSQNGVEIEIKYDYLTTVRDTVRRLLHIEDADTDTDDRHWALLLPTSKVDGKLLSLWLDPTRTLASYNLYGKEAMETIEGSGPSLLRLLVLTQRPQELNLVKAKWEEDETVMWWMKTLVEDKWREFDPAENHSKWRKLKAMARKGIPGFLRGDIWPIITGARYLMVPGLYKKLYTQDPDPIIKNKVRRDLDRTLPFHPYFQVETGQEQLYRVLIAFANMEPEMGYCQGTNFVVGVLLLTTNEEMTFWILIALMRGYNMREFYTNDVALLSSSLQQFELCIQLMAPDVYQHFKREMVEMNLIVSSWFLTLFSREGQLELSQHLWDVFFHEGFSIIFRTAMAILKEGKDLLLSVDIEGIRDYFHSSPRLITDPSILLNIAYKIPKGKIMSRVFSKEEVAELEASLAPKSKSAKKGDRIEKGKVEKTNEKGTKSDKVEKGGKSDKVEKGGKSDKVEKDDKGKDKGNSGKGGKGDKKKGKGDKEENACTNESNKENKDENEENKSRDTEGKKSTDGDNGEEGDNAGEADGEKEGTKEDEKAKKEETNFVEGDDVRYGLFSKKLQNSIDPSSSPHYQIKEIISASTRVGYLFHNYKWVMGIGDEEEQDELYDITEMSKRDIKRERKEMHDREKREREERERERKERERREREMKKAKKKPSPSQTTQTERSQDEGDRSKLSKGEESTRVNLSVVEPELSPTKPQGNIHKLPTSLNRDDDGKGKSGDSKSMAEGEDAKEKDKGRRSDRSGRDTARGRREDGSDSSSKKSFTHREKVDDTEKKSDRSGRETARDKEKSLSRSHLTTPRGGRSRKENEPVQSKKVIKITRDKKRNKLRRSVSVSALEVGSPMHQTLERLKRDGLYAGTNSEGPGEDSTVSAVEGDEGGEGTREVSHKTLELDRVKNRSRGLAREQSSKSDRSDRDKSLNRPGMFRKKNFAATKNTPSNVPSTPVLGSLSGTTTASTATAADTTTTVETATVTTTEITTVATEAISVTTTETRTVTTEAAEATFVTADTSTDTATTTDTTINAPKSDLKNGK